MLEIAEINDSHRLQLELILSTEIHIIMMVAEFTSQKKRA
jgi:hypothetical protein